MKHSPLGRQFATVALVTAGLLLIPLVAMQFTREVNWGFLDFAVAALILLAGGTAIVLANRSIRGRSRRALAILAVVMAAALVWAELAVGIFR